MYKAISILLCLALMLGILGACGSTAAPSTASGEASQASVSAAEPASSENGQTDDNAEPADELENSAADLGEAEEASEFEEEHAIEPESMNTYHTLPLADGDVTFTMFDGMNPLLMTYIDSYEDAGIFKWLQETTGIHVEIPAVHPASQNEQFSLMVASGDYSDFMGNMSLYTGGLEGAMSDEVIYDLNEFKDQMPLFFAAIDSYEDSARDCRLDNGAIAMTYMVYTGDYAVYDTGLLLRTDWLNEMGMDLPHTYDEYYDVLTAFHNEHGATAWFSGSGSPFLAHGYNIRAGYSFGWMSGLDCFYIEDGQVQCGFLTDAFQDYIAMMQKWYSEDLLYKDFYNNNTGNASGNSDSLAGVVSGQYSLFEDGATNYSIYKDYDIEIGATYYPVLNEGDKIHVRGGTTRVSQSKYAVSTSCENPELACEWLDIWYSKEAAVAANWGVEGETFEYDENGNPYFTDMITNNPDGMSMSIAVDVYTAPTGCYLVDYRKYSVLWSEDEFEALEIWATDVDGENTLSSFATMTTEETDEYTALAGDLTTYVSTELTKFITGEKNLDSDMDDFIQTLKDMGIERCVELKQASYDRYIVR